jgi:hypothetical protein
MTHRRFDGDRSFARRNGAVAQRPAALVQRHGRAAVDRAGPGAAPSITIRQHAGPRPAATVPHGDSPRMRGLQGRRALRGAGALS